MVASKSSRSQGGHAKRISLRAECKGFRSRGANASSALGSKTAPCRRRPVLGAFQVADYHGAVCATSSVGQSRAASTYVQVWKTRPIDTPPALCPMSHNRSHRPLAFIRKVSVDDNTRLLIETTVDELARVAPRAGFSIRDLNNLLDSGMELHELIDCMAMTALKRVA